ncbi:MAG: hypothetical protein RLZZ618_3755 [Pseudomonadota bacterium]|jgi:tRNA pseudouridine32 synthase/23S rRNA pseudouridine746 synthase
MRDDAHMLPQPSTPHALAHLPVIPPGPLDLLYTDDTVIVLVKPAGLLSVPGRGDHAQDCMAHRVQAEFADALVVHRLDMATSGLMVFARGKPAQRQLSEAFAGRLVDKRYEAIVHGLPEPVHGDIDLPLITDWPNRPRQKVDFSDGKPSLTRYRTLQHDERTSGTRVSLEPVTGRTHQLRVHLAAIGHPLLGDMLYAPTEVQALTSRLMLHACVLSFAHPANGEPLSFESAPPF